MSKENFYDIKIVVKNPNTECNPETPIKMLLQEFIPT